MVLIFWPALKSFLAEELEEALKFVKLEELNYDDLGFWEKRRKTDER